MTIVYIVFLIGMYLFMTHKFSKAVVADMVKRKTDKQGVFLLIIVWIVSLFWPVWLLVGIADFLLSDKEK